MTKQKQVLRNKITDNSHLQKYSDLLEGSPISKEELWSSVRGTIRFTSLTKQDPSPLIAQFAGQLTLGRVLVGPEHC